MDQECRGGVAMRMSDVCAGEEGEVEWLMWGESAADVSSPR